MVDIVFIPMLIMAGVAAASAIAGAVQNQAGMDAQEEQNQLNRNEQKKLAQAQVNQQQQQATAARQQGAYGSALSALQNSDNNEHTMQAKKQQATAGIQGTLAKAFLGGG